MNAGFVERVAANNSFKPKPLRGSTNSGFRSMRDGEIDYSGYTQRELLEGFAFIDKQLYPKNYANLRAAYKFLTSSDIEEDQPRPKDRSGERSGVIPPAARMPGPMFVYFNWHGRISRKTFWIFGLLPAAIYAIVEYGLPQPDAWYSWLLLITSVLLSLMVDIKRCHDRGRTGWFSLLMLVPLLNLWPFVELGFLPGTPGHNHYGQPVLW